ncbi:hypothetical protein CQW23_01521 [Capsicum baccatum]|uniref:RING-type domain-containing protein n=1 Tax=Capsicum baccatum TaxID=33114 RepID=A0A2G2XNV1_CAPBA|nr:hypothetical protein CQW23_01521 [Capsicum baccatum]
MVIRYILGTRVVKWNTVGFAGDSNGVEEYMELGHRLWIELRKTRDCFADVNSKLERNDNGSYIVRISATSTIVVAELRRPLELLTRGKIVQHMNNTPTVVQLLFSREGINIMRIVHGETGAYIHLNKHSLHVRIFYSSDNVDRVEQRFIDSLLAVHENVNCKLKRNNHGSYIVSISITSTIIVAELRRPLELLMRGKIVQHVDITQTIVQLLFSQEGINIIRTVHGKAESYIHLDKHSLHVRIFGSSDNVDRVEQRFIDSLLALHESKQIEVHLRGGILPPDLIKRVVTIFGPDLSVLKEKVPGVEFSLNTKRHCICINGTTDMKQSVEDIISEIAQSSFPTQTTGDEAHCVVCLYELEDPYRLEACTHAFCLSCFLEQCKSAIKRRERFPHVLFTFWL